ncbi:MAG: hypothetical protein AB8B87_14565 [Granulosicoccus sp.]
MKSVFRKPVAMFMLAASLLLGKAGLAHADNGYLVINTLALHFENFDDRNAFTPGVGWEYSPSAKIGWHIGTLSDSFGYQSAYGGINYATKPKLNGKLRFMIGATILHKQFKKNGEPETKLVPLPAMEFRMSERTVLNLSGSPQVDFGDQKNNAVLFFQLKIAVR